MDLLLVADQKVEPGWVCGLEGLQDSGNVKWKPEKGEGKRKFHCFRSKELQEMISLNPDLRRAPWFKSIPDVTRDEFLLLLVYRVTERRIGIEADSRIHEVLIGPAAYLLFVPHVHNRGRRTNSTVRECLESRFARVEKYHIYETLYDYNDFAKYIFFKEVTKKCITSKSFKCVMEWILDDSNCEPILARITRPPVTSETNSICRDHLKDLQVPKRPKISDDPDKRTREGPVTRSQSKGDPNSGKPVTGTQTKQQESGSEIIRSSSQPSHHTKHATGTNEQMPAAGYSSRSTSSGLSQYCKYTQLQDQSNSAEGTSAGLQNPQASMSPVSQSPCATGTDFREKLGTSDAVHRSFEKPSSEAVVHNNKHVFNSIPDGPNSSSHYNVSTATSHFISATICSTVISISTPFNNDTKGIPAPINRNENSEPLQNPTKTGTFTETISDTKSPLPSPGMPQHYSTLSSSALDIQTATTTPGTQTDTETSTSSQNIKPSISSSSIKATNVPQNMIVDTGDDKSAQCKTIPSTPRARNTTIDFIKQTSSTQNTKTAQSKQNDRNATTGEDTKTTMSAQGTRPVTLSQDTKTVDTTQNTKTDRTPQDNKTVSSYQDKTAKIVDSTHDSRSDRTPQDKKTADSCRDKNDKIGTHETDRTPGDKKAANSSHDKAAKIVDPTQGIKTERTLQDKKTANSSQDKSVALMEATPGDKKAANSSHDKAAEIVDPTQGIKTDRTLPDKKTANSSRDQSVALMEALQTTSSAQSKKKPKSSQDNKRVRSVKFLKPLPPTSCCRAKDDNCGIKRKRFGEFPAAIRNKTVLLLGAKGSGKTCLVNAVANFIKGDDSNSEKWMVSDEAIETGGFKSTENITGYSFVIKEKESEDLALTLIDTPGLNDSSGNEVRDHVESLKTFLANAAHKKLEIHAIALVVQAHLVRLTSSERLLMDHLKTLFGQDVSDHVVNLITFADNQSKPPVVEALNQYGISTRHCMKFNNSVFCGLSDESEKELDRVYWKTSHKSWKKCWKVVKDLGPLKTNVMKSIQKELYVANVKASAVQELQEEMKALQKIYKGPYNEQIEERRQRVWDKARVVHQILETTDSITYPSFWCLIENAVCEVNGRDEQSKEMVEFLLAGSPMQLKDAVVALLVNNYILKNNLEGMEAIARSNIAGKIKNQNIKDILFSTKREYEGAFPKAKNLLTINTAKAIENLVNDHISNSSLGVVEYLNCLTNEVEPKLCDIIKIVCDYLVYSKHSQQR
ncbi:uncharacterized protein LOC143037558 [Oratosquilla oratoria]|uniref:uncharacterized protein LOC143037558 n=1 Tax=Oratosquilla oratoria TaxID=337810 RepID=UPI003F760BCE